MREETYIHKREMAYFERCEIGYFDVILCYVLHSTLF